MTTPDFIFIGATVAFFALSVLYAFVCEKFRWLNRPENRLSLVVSPNSFPPWKTSSSA